MFVYRPLSLSIIFWTCVMICTAVCRIVCCNVFGLRSFLRFSVVTRRLFIALPTLEPLTHCRAIFSVSPCVVVVTLCVFQRCFLCRCPCLSSVVHSLFQPVQPSMDHFVTHSVPSPRTLLVYFDIFFPRTGLFIFFHWSASCPCSVCATTLSVPSLCRRHVWGLIIADQLVPPFVEISHI